MTDKYVKVIAHYSELFKSVINGGTGSGDYIEGGTVTMTADSIEGKQFKEWLVVSGNVTLADKTKSTTTFTMPAGNVEVKAIYEDTPAINQEGNTIPENENIYNGNVPEENQKEPSPLKTDDKTQSDVVKTEDQTNMEVFILMILSVGLMIYGCYFTKKKSSK